MPRNEFCVLIQFGHIDARSTTQNARSATDLESAGQAPSVKHVLCDLCNVHHTNSIFLRQAKRNNRSELEYQTLGQSGGHSAPNTAESHNMYVRVPTT